NQWIERDVDALMKRTADRPLPAKRLQPAIALWFGGIISMLGFLIFAFAINSVAALAAIFTHLSYLAVYTPLKRHSSWSTFVGAFPGAMPPLIGFVCATGKFTWAAFIPFAILFLWQMPHFFSIGWLYRED